MKTVRFSIPLIILIALVLPAFLSCAKNTPAPSGGKPIVIVSVMPQAYFVQRIAGDRISVVVLVGKGQDPHSYEPRPRQMAEVSKASLWLTIGVEFEKALVRKVSSLYPNLTIADTSTGVVFRQLESHAHEGESAQAGGEIEAGSATDPHIWLGRQAVKAMALSISSALGRIDPAGAADYRRNALAFTADVDKAYDSISSELTALRGKRVFVYHPAFGYFLDEFGIAQEAVETGGKEPTQKALAALIGEARADGAKVIFVQAQFPSSAAETVAGAIGGVVLRIDPLAEDWLANIVRLGDALKEAIP